MSTALRHATDPQDDEIRDVFNGTIDDGHIATACSGPTRDDHSDASANDDPLAEPAIATLCTEYEQRLQEYRSATAKSVELALALAEVVWRVSETKCSAKARMAFSVKYRLTDKGTFSQF